MKLLSTLAAAAATAALALPATAHELVYTTTLSGPAEFPSNGSTATGSATVTVDLDLATLRVEATFSGLSGTTTASHIHCCVDPGAATPTAGVATQTPTFTGFPLGVTSGSYDHTFSLGLASTYNNAFAGAGSSPSVKMNALLAGLAAGDAYLNIHTSTFGGGEIRGFLALQPVPEPGTWALMLGGLGLLGVAGRRQAVRQPRLRLR